MMSWIQTHSGRRFDPLDPQPEQVEIGDIAHALSLLCRFNGHCRGFYSVAQHSVHVSEQVAPEHALAALLHDAGEAYVSDLPRPIKRAMPRFSEIEDHVLEVVLGRFGLSMPLPPEVHAADDALLATELRDLMAPPPEPWQLQAAPLPMQIVPVGAAEAEARFLARCAQLVGLK